MSIFEFTKKGKKTFEKPSQDIQGRIVNKLKSIKRHPDIFSILVSVECIEPATHRLRVGDYRLLLEYLGREKNEDYFMILKVQHRNGIYRDSI